MAMINGTNFKSNGKFHNWLVRAIALRSLILIGFSLGTVISAPALALMPPEFCIPSPFNECIPGGGVFEPEYEPNPKPPKEPKDPEEPQPKPTSQPKPDPSVCNKKPYLPQCN